MNVIKYTGKNDNRWLQKEIEYESYYTRIQGAYEDGNGTSLAEQIEIIPWKVRTNDFYSRVAMHQNNKRVSFFYASRRVNKNRSSTFHGMMFLFYAN